MRQFLIALLLPLQATAGMSLVASPSSPAANRLLQDTLAVLPARFHQVINTSVTVQFRALDGHARLQEPCRPGSDRQIYGEFRNGRIALNQNLLAVMEGADRSMACKHGSYRKLAVASLVHELTHLFDDRTRASKSITFRAMVGAETTAAGDGKLKNQLATRSPDPYELTNVTESFAVNTEFFLLDPQFACRRPNIARHLSGVFGKPLPTCSASSRVRFVGTDGGVDHVDLSPANVREVHYLLAGQGSGMMNRFGHSMFRLVMNNSDDDIVVGFAGIINDTRIDSMAGLTGEYPSRLVVGPYAKTLQNYSRVQLRDMNSYPLSFTSAQKDSFLSQVVSLYWEYAGRYYFLGNNCATEAMDLLKVVHHNPAFLRARPLTPKGVLDALVTAGLTAEARAVSVPSHWGLMERIYSRTAQPFGNLDRYWENSAAARRPHLRGDLRSLRAFFALESAISERDHRAVEGKLMEHLHRLPGDEPLRREMTAAATNGNRLTFGDARSGYGIPLEGDVQLSDAQEVARAQSHAQWVQGWLKQWGDMLLRDSEEMNEAQATLENLKQLRDDIARIQSQESP